MMLPSTITAPLRPAVLALCCLLTGCSHLPNFFQDKTTHVKQLIEQQRFYPALDYIDHTPTDDPAYTELTAIRDDVLTAIAAYEKEHLKTAEQLTSDDQWGNALITIEQALQNVPASKSLLNKREQIRRRIEPQLTRLQLELATQRATSLPQETRLLTAIQRYAPSEQNTVLLARNEQEREASSALLIAETQRLIAAKHWQSARQYALLAHQLKNNSTTQSLLRQIDTAIQSGKAGNLKAALDENDLLRAKKLGADIDRKSADADTRALLEQLNGKLKLAVLQLTRDGQQAYTRGEINKAIEFWQQALALDESNGELQKLLQRAKTFKDNYQRFKQN